MRVYISADLEGVAGVVSPQQTRVEGFEFQLARRWMTQEVLAASEAAREAGATEVIVSDSHASGQNLLLDELPQYVRVVRSWPRPLGMMQGVEVGRYVGAVLLGHHTGAHHRTGVLAHTLHSRMIQALRLNGRPASEIVLAAATGGHYGVPVLLVTGDDATCEHAREALGDVHTVATKSSLGTISALTLTPAAACERIHAGVTTALARAATREVFRLDTPVEVEVELKSPRTAELLAYLPHVERWAGAGVRWRSADVPAVVRMLEFMLNYTPVPN